MYYRSKYTHKMAVSNLISILKVCTTIGARLSSGSRFFELVGMRERLDEY